MYDALDQLHLSLVAVVIVLICVGLGGLNVLKGWRKNAAAEAKETGRKEEEIRQQLKHDYEKIQELESWKKDHSTRCTEEHEEIKETIRDGLAKTSEMIQTAIKEAAKDRAAMLETVNKLATDVARIKGQIEK